MDTPSFEAGLSDVEQPKTAFRMKKRKQCTAAARKTDEKSGHFVFIFLLQVDAAISGGWEKRPPL